MASGRCLGWMLLVGWVTTGCAGGPRLAPSASDPSAPRASDVVLVIEQSTAGLLASGVDVDEDGVVGRTRSFVAEADPFSKPASSWTTDPDDTAHALQMRVARALVPALAARENRLGLLSFTQRVRQHELVLERHTDRPLIEAPVGSSEAVLAALDEVPPARQHRRSDLARSLSLAAGLLDRAEQAGTGRRRVILLLSLGRPSAPDGIHFASQRALEVAHKLRRHRIELWAIPCVTADLDFLDELTRITGGRLVQLNQLEEHFGGV